MDVDAVGRGPGGKRVGNVTDKLASGEAASEGETSV